MKCNKCKKVYRKTLSNCPSCGEINHIMLEEKTIAISEIKEDLSLTGLISNQIEEFNEEKKEEEKKTTKSINKKKINKKIKKSKKRLLISSVILLVIILFIIGIFIYRNANKEKYDYISELSLILEDYDNVQDKTEIYDILAYVVNDDEKIENVHNNTYRIVKQWVDLYKNNEYSGIEEVEKKTKELKDNIKYLMDIDYEGIKLLDYNDYDEFIDMIDEYYDECKVFYEGLSYYNKKYFNEAYMIMGNIQEDNYFYNKSREYQEKIVSDVIILLKNDVDNIVSNINDDDYTDKELLDVYSEIENMIIVYSNVYESIGLASEDEYQELLSEYNAKVIEYTDKVVSE